MNILQLIEKTGHCYTKKASTKGGEYAGSCPWCGGQDRFGVYPEIDHYVCRRCKKAGDSLQFVREFYNKTYRESCIYLGIAPARRILQGNKKDKSSIQAIKWEPRKIELPSKIWQKKAEAFLFEKFKFLLSGSGQKYRDWLNDRGINNQTIKVARFGYNTQSIVFDRSSWGLSPEKKENGKHKKIWIPAGLIIPQFQYGKLIQLRIRQENPITKDRFIMVSGSAMGYFNYAAHLATSEYCPPDSAFITEAGLDGWLVQQEAGDLVRVYAIGNASARPDIGTDKTLKNMPGLLNLDNDDAGKIEFPWWQKHYPRMNLWLSAKKKDPGEDYQAGVSIRDWIKKGLESMGRADKKNVDQVDTHKSDPVQVKKPKRRAIPIRKSPNVSSEKELPGDGFYKGKVCLHGVHCASLKNGVCLKCKQPISTLERCPRDSWWFYTEGSITQIIIGPGVKRY